MTETPQPLNEGLLKQQKYVGEQESSSAAQSLDPNKLNAPDRRQNFLRRGFSWGLRIAALALLTTLPSDLNLARATQDLTDSWDNHPSALTINLPSINGYPDSYQKEVLVKYHNNSGEVVTDGGPNIVQVILGEDKKPSKLILPDGREEKLDPKNIDRDLQKAKAANDNELVAAIRINIPDPAVELMPPIYPPNHPLLTSLPGDIVTDQVLQQRGINIIQADYTHLYIRESAFTDGGVLSGFKNGNEKITIALLDGDLVTQNAAQAPRYDQVRALLAGRKQEIQNIKRAKIEELAKEFQMYQNLKPDSNGNYYIPWMFGTLPIIPSQFLGIKSEPKAIIELYNSGMFSDEEIMLMNQDKILSDAAGLYFQPTNQRQAVVFAAVGREEEQMGLEEVFVTPEGKTVEEFSPWVFVTSANDLVDEIGIGLDPRFAYPNPKDFPTNPKASPNNSRSYPYGGIFQGFILNHELEHHKLITERLLQGLKPDYSEYDTDMAAMNMEQRGWNAWRGSGDNRQYQFVWLIPHRGFISN